jgi:hypothetical protein
MRKSRQGQFYLRPNWLDMNVGTVGADPMLRNRWTRTLLALALGATGAVLPSQAADYRCSNGDLVRRVEVRRTDTSQRGSCEVRYWRNAAAGGAGQSLWRSDRDPDYCAPRARELIARLESGGWRCTSGGPARQAGAVDAGPAAQAEPPPADLSVQHTPAPEFGSRDVAIAAEPISPAIAPAARSATPAAAPPSPAIAQPEPSATPAAGPPAPAIARTAPYLAPTAPPPSPAIAQTTPAAAPGPPPSPPAPALTAPAAPASSPALAHTAPPQSDHLPRTTSAHPEAALLDRVVEQTLQSVQELYGGRLEAELAAFGDLDRDGLKDAAVLVTYQADRQEHVQYLVAYLFDGETFRSVATKNVGGRFLDAARADLRGIVDGRILVELEALDEAANCCARHRTAFTLENGQLVQVADPDTTRLERTSPTERPAPG